MCKVTPRQWKNKLKVRGVPTENKNSKNKVFTRERQKCSQDSGEGENVQQARKRLKEGEKESKKIMSEQSRKDDANMVVVRLPPLLSFYVAFAREDFCIFQPNSFRLNLPREN